MSKVELTAIGSHDFKVKQKEDKDEDASPSTQREWRHWLIGVIALLYMFGQQLSLFTISQYIYRRLQIQEYPNHTFITAISYCEKNRSMLEMYRAAHVQKVASGWNIYFAVLSGVPAVVSNFILGSLTDKYGRKFLLITSMTGTLLRNLMCLLGVYINMSLRSFTAAFLLEGLTGQAFTVLLVAYSYVADVTTGRSRTVGIVLMEMMIGLAVTFSIFSGGYFLQASGFKNPLIASICVVVAGLIVAIFILPESYRKENRKHSADTCFNLRNAFKFYFSRSYRGKRWKYILCLLVFFFTVIDVIGRLNVESLYQMNAPFCWTPQKLGWFGALRSGLQQVVGMASIRILQMFLSDEGIAILASVSYATGFILEAFAKSDTVLYVVTAVGSLGFLTIPMIRSIMSRMTSKDKQGAITAGIAAVETICQMTANVIASSIYAATVTIFGGLIFLVFALFNVISIVLLMYTGLYSFAHLSSAEM